MKVRPFLFQQTYAQVHRICAELYFKRFFNILVNRHEFSALFLRNVTVSFLENFVVVRYYRFLSVSIEIKLQNICNKSLLCGSSFVVNI